GVAWDVRPCTVGIGAPAYERAQNAGTSSPLPRLPGGPYPSTPSIVVERHVPTPTPPPSATREPSKRKARRRDRPRRRHWAGATPLPGANGVAELRLGPRRAGRRLALADTRPRRPRSAARSR